MPQYAETVVISVGGSLIVPEEIDTQFIANLKEVLEVHMSYHGRRFIIITGGGRTARKYQTAVEQFIDLNMQDLDWIGIYATRLNGNLLRTIFKEHAYRQMITNPDEILDVPEDFKLVVAAGYRPGASTDLRAVQIAERINAQKVVNLTNTDYIFTTDPKENPDAERIETITWDAFRKLIPERWDPGLNAPFDPIASKEAQEAGIEVASINGNNLESLSSYLEGEDFTGTRIHP